MSIEIRGHTRSSIRSHRTEIDRDWRRVPSGGTRQDLTSGAFTNRDTGDFSPYTVGDLETPAQVPWGSVPVFERWASVPVPRRENGPTVGLTWKAVAPGPGRPLEFGHSSHHTPCDERLDAPACSHHQVHFSDFALHSETLPRGVKCNRDVLGQAVLAFDAMTQPVCSQARSANAAVWKTAFRHPWKGALRPRERPNSRGLEGMPLNFWDRLHIVLQFLLRSVGGWSRP